KGLDTKFEALDITEEEKLKYVGTEQDCGSNDEKFLKHCNACVGLRNLRLQTLKQSQGMLKMLDQRRGQIVKLIKDSREVETESGQNATVPLRTSSPAITHADRRYAIASSDGWLQAAGTGVCHAD